MMTFVPDTMTFLSARHDDFKLTPHSPFPFHPSPSPLILHDGFLSPAPAFPIDALSTHLAPQSRAPSPIALPFTSVFDFDDSDDQPHSLFDLNVELRNPVELPNAGNGQSPTREVPQRPPVRPHAAVRSKFDLEPNPFEQSFSKSSHHSNSSSSPHSTPPRGTDATSIKHNALPPLSSLTSPAAADPSQFPWLASQSLRTGPLSPAMLAGPQQLGQGHNGSNLRSPSQENNSHQQGGAFDQNTFRTGFTPGSGSGYTPNYSSLMAGSFANSLPIPSPNTAAFLNMVTNSTPIEGSADNSASNQNINSQQNDGHRQPQHPHPPSAIPPHLQQQQQHHGLSHLQSQNDMPQETITPGTLSALTGVFNEMNRPGNNAGPPPPSSFFPQQMHQAPGQQQIPQGVDYAQQSANAASQAANGLFLLSQAHQELSKREEEGRGSGPPRRRVSSNPTTRSSNPTNPSTGQKRKSDAGQLPNKATGAPPAKKGKKASPKKEEIVSPDFSVDTADQNDDDDDEDKKPLSGIPESEEDKRKNFLERNRQGK